jgi:hypothetical protein
MFFLVIPAKAGHELTLEIKTGIVDMPLIEEKTAFVLLWSVRTNVVTVARLLSLGDQEF